MRERERERERERGTHSIHDEGSSVLAPVADRTVDYFVNGAVDSREHAPA